MLGWGWDSDQTLLSDSWDTDKLTGLFHLRCQHAARKDGPGSLRLGIKQTGSRTAPDVKNERAGKSGVDMTHRVTRRKQAAPVPAWGERRSQDSGKKHKSHTPGKAQGKLLNFTCEDLWDPQKILNRQAWARRTKLRRRQMIKFGTSPEKLRTPLDTFAILYARFEQVCRDLGEVDQHFDKEFGGAAGRFGKAQRMVEIASQQVHDSRMDCHRLCWIMKEKDSNSRSSCGEHPFPSVKMNRWHE